MAKQHSMALIMVSHVTKEGIIAGPRVLEHMVDTVLYFEGERNHHFRLLRSIKNRFGAVDEVGVFEMHEKGLVEISNPSALAIHGNSHEMLSHIPTGSCIFCSLEGTRAILVEIQALVVPSFLTTPRRSVVGWDSHRLAMILAVLDAHGNMSLGQKDVFLNVVGGFKIQETGADLAVVLALISAFKKIPLPLGLLVCGEVGLTGEIRSVTRLQSRIREALKMNLTQGILVTTSEVYEGFEIFRVHHINDVMNWFHHMSEKTLTASI
jgi:DNA repair protein RadA/Sms